MLSIVIPTLNEAKSIKPTILSLTKKLDDENFKFEIIVCDDNSSDRTWEVVKDLKQYDGRVRLIRRFNKKGLSNAVIDGFRMARGENMLVMDADGQHDEKIIGNMIRYANDFDIVIGSRYLSKDGVYKWSISRIFMSKAASYLAYPLIRQKGVSDPLSGFFLIKRNVFEKTCDKLKISGFKILLDILLALPLDVKVKEIPYEFKKRKHDKSKMRISVVIDYFRLLAQGYLNRYNVFMKFIIVGFFGTIINLGLLYVLVEYLNTMLVLASFIAIELSIINNFILNNFWTFKRRTFNHSYISRFIGFNSASIISLIINMAVFYLLTSLGLWYIMSQLAGIIFAFLINFVVNNFFVFKDEAKI